MKRRTLVAIFVLMLATRLGLSLEIHRDPYVQNVTQTAITIMWETDSEASAEVLYGKQGSPQLDQSKSNENQAEIHEIRIEGLTPESHYNYKIISRAENGEEVESEVYTFRTAPYRDTPFRFAVWADSHAYTTPAPKIAELISAQNPDIVISSGDVTNNGGVYREWDLGYLTYIRHFAGSVPSYVAPGNHEQNSHWIDDLLAQPGNEHWFAFTYGNSRFIILDTNRLYYPDRDQYNWLVEELSSDECKSADFRFVFCHHPPYSEQWDSPGYTGEAGVRTFLVPLFEEYGVDIVFSGHTHDYERGKNVLENGHEIYFIITGGGGGRLDKVETKDWDVIQLHKSVHHCITVDVDGSILDVRAVGQDGEIIDSFRKVNLRTDVITTINPAGKFATTWAGIKAR
jgi:predicted phosphodiesterase